MPKTEAEIRDLIERFTQASREPLLETEEIDELVARSKRRDKDGRSPDDPDWEPTWSINAAVALGWEQKAAKLATDFDISSADQSLRRSQAYEMCIRQADRWRRRIVDSPQLEGSLRRSQPEWMLDGDGL